MGFDSYIALRQTRYESDDKNNFIYSYNIFVKTTPNEKKKNPIEYTQTCKLSSSDHKSVGKNAENVKPSETNALQVLIN